MDNNSILFMSADPDEPFRRAFQAVGHDHDIILKQEGHDNETYFRRRIIESIQIKCSKKSHIIRGRAQYDEPELKQ